MMKWFLIDSSTQHGYFSLKMVLMLIHVYSWFLGLHSNQCRSSRPYLKWIGKLVSLALWNDPRGFLSSFIVRPASSWGVTGMSGFLSRQSRGIEPHLKTRRGKGAEIEVCRETGYSSQVRTGMSGNFWSYIKGVEYHFEFQEGMWDFSQDAAVGKGLNSRWQAPFRSSIAGSLQSWNRRVRPHLVLRNGTPLASRVVHGVTGHLSSCIWDLQIFPYDATGVSIPRRVVTSSSGLHSKRCPGIRNYL